jgi:hypothetical protein
MLRLERSLHGHPQIAKQMMEHLPGKTARQIRDKRNDPSYKALLERQISTEKPSATPARSEIICMSSDSETEIRTTDTKGHVSETEDEDTDEGEVSRQPSPSYPVNAEATPLPETLARTRTPGLLEMADRIGAGYCPGDEDRASPITERGANSITLHEQNWRNGVLLQALAET